MQKTIIELVCDDCGSTEDVQGRTLKVNRREVVLDACTDCWPTDTFERLLKAGRKPGTERLTIVA